MWTVLFSISTCFKLFHMTSVNGMTDDVKFDLQHGMTHILYYIPKTPIKYIWTCTFKMRNVKRHLAVTQHIMSLQNRVDLKKKNRFECVQSESCTKKDKKKYISAIKWGEQFLAIYKFEESYMFFISISFERTKIKKIIASLFRKKLLYIYLIWNPVI